MRSFAILLLAALPLLAAAPSLPKNDENAIRDLLQDYIQAFNQHDVKALTNLFASDGDLRTSWNDVGRNHREIEAIYTAEHTKRQKNAHLDAKIESIRMIKPDLALVDVESTITGMETEVQTKYPPLNHHVVVLLVKREGTWKILVGRPF